MRYPIDVVFVDRHGCILKVVEALPQVVHTGGINVKSDHRAVLAKLDRQRKAYIAQSNDGDVDGFFAHKIIVFWVIKMLGS